MAIIKVKKERSLAQVLLWGIFTLLFVWAVIWVVIEVLQLVAWVKYI